MTQGDQWQCWFKTSGLFSWLLANFATSLIVLTTHGAVLWTFHRTWKNNPLPLSFFPWIFFFFKADKLYTLTFCKRQKMGSKCSIRPKPKLHSSILKSQWILVQRLTHTTWSLPFHTLSAWRNGMIMADCMSGSTSLRVSIATHTNQTCHLL